MVTYWVTLYFDKARFRNNPIFTVNTAVAIDDYITNAFEDYGSSLKLEEVEIRKTTSDTLIVFIQLCDEDSDLCIYGYEDNYEGGYLESTSFDSDTIYAMECAEEGVADEIAEILDVKRVEVEVDPDSLPDY